GLTGIGRRTFIQHSLKNVLNFKKVSILTIENGDNINDICIKLTTMSEPYSNKSELSNLVSTVKKLNIDESITRIINNIKSLNQKNELLIFVDEGGLLDDEGYLSSHMITFLQNFPCDGQAYLFIISNRKPQNIPYQVYAPTYYLKPLNDNDTKKLLTLHFRNLNLSFNPGQISELSEYIAGYPPAAFYAAQICHIYGIELILADKSK
ncbi:MAG: hypothetical protein OEM52_02795, partial [bacterium]|nr:hypothetical protein [bacterium]